MTLTTHIAIVEPTPVLEVFGECRRVLGGEHARFEHTRSSWRRGCSQYRNEAGQGLDALLWIYYGADAPIAPNDEYADDDPNWRSAYPPVDGWSIEVCFDTPYAYRGPQGGGCDDLHAYLVHELGRWLNKRGLTWYWQHEYTGEWHPSADPVTILGDPERGRLPRGGGRMT